MAVREELPMYEHTVLGLQPDASYSVAVRCGWNGQPARLDVTTLPDDQENQVSGQPTGSPPTSTPEALTATSAFFYRLPSEKFSP